jgi:peptidylprolyl isomerase
MDRFRVAALACGLVLFAAFLSLGAIGCTGGKETSEDAEMASVERETAQRTEEPPETMEPAETEPQQPSEESVAVTEPKEEDYTTTASGLKYYDLVVGDGPSPQPGQTVSVHYTGRFLDGRKFDSSVDRNTPFSFPLGQGRVIKGWDEGVATMKVGGKRKLIVPSDLAYGEKGHPAGIPPNTVLTFDVELLDFK